MPSLTRRGFLAGAATAASASRVLGANDRVRLGIIGVGGRGTYLAREANRCPTSSGSPSATRGMSAATKPRN